jgi:hypothetical protein
MKPFRRKGALADKHGCETYGSTTSPPIEPGNTCTQVQVFHRQYREKEAKIGAKVILYVTYLFCFIYNISMWKLAVLGDWFGPQNVTSVPSLPGSG